MLQNSKIVFLRIANIALTDYFLFYMFFSTEVFCRRRMPNSLWYSRTNWGDCKNIALNNSHCIKLYFFLIGRKFEKNASTRPHQT